MTVLLEEGQLSAQLEKQRFAYTPVMHSRRNKIP